MSDLCYGKQIWDYSDVNCLIDEFIELYKNRPIINNRGGMLSAHLFWAWFVVRKLKPANIIESGVFKGQGTWLFKQACPEAKIFSIDPVLEQREYIDDTAVYFTEDFSMINWTEYLDPKDTLVFFDDHQNAYMRLQQMKWMGFIHAMFEDNYPVKQGDCYSLKKIFAESGFAYKGNIMTAPNAVHADYVRSNIETYTTLPPLCKLKKTRWGDEWNEIDYPTGQAILSKEKLEEYPIIKEEAGFYTWICYVKLKG